MVRVPLAYCFYFRGTLPFNARPIGVMIHRCPLNECDFDLSVRKRDCGWLSQESFTSKFVGYLSGISRMHSDKSTGYLSFAGNTYGMFPVAVVGRINSSAP